MTRAEGQRVRIRDDFNRLRAAIDSLEAVVEDELCPPGPDMVQIMVHAATNLACSAAKLEAYMIAEADVAMDDLEAG